MNEVWKDIEGYEGIYQISSLGRVYSVRTDKIRKTFVNRHGYPRVVLRVKGVEKNISIHRLVAKAFLPNPLKLKEVNHIDGNKMNNKPSNLEWCTKSENIKHAFRIGLKDYHGSKGPSARKVIDTRTGIVYGTLKECAEKNGISPTQLGRALRGEIPSINNFNYLEQ